RRVDRTAAGTAGSPATRSQSGPERVAASGLAVSGPTRRRTAYCAVPRRASGAPWVFRCRWAACAVHTAKKRPPRRGGLSRDRLRRLLRRARRAGARLRRRRRARAHRVGRLLLRAGRTWRRLPVLDGRDEQVLVDGPAGGGLEPGLLAPRPGLVARRRRQPAGDLDGLA